MAPPWMLAALTTGLVGSLHCIGMCGPLAAALPIGRLPSGQRGLAIGVYHLSRIAAYAGLGLAAGSFGQGLVLLGLQRPISIGAGLFLLALGYGSPFRKFGLLNNRTTGWLLKPMSRLLQHPSVPMFAGLGFLNGLLPCGFVYVALAGAVVTTQAASGIAYMALFGLGTVPALLIIRQLPHFFPATIRQRMTRLMPVVTILLGLLLIGRGIYQPLTASHASGAIPLCHGSLPIAKSNR